KEGVKIHNSLFWKPADPIEGYYSAGESGTWYLRAENTADIELLPGAERVAQGAYRVPGMSPDEARGFLQKHEGEACEAMKIWPGEEG
ncbi:hypothetical protein LJC49_08750, partial [Ruminococcaceae bacterium OttesenSCG-928-I18]|nr:hypothetical protein [Ruminococcaceae bacterium OttesenSCG-928-I18]